MILLKYSISSLLVPPKNCYRHYNISLSLSCKMQMGSELLTLLAFKSILIGLAFADWNILHQRKKTSKVDICLKNYCESWRINVELNNIKGFDSVPQECIEYIGKYMTSTQYKWDLQRALEGCALFTSSCCNFKCDVKDAWIFDIDDMLLLTVPYFKIHYFG